MLWGSQSIHLVTKYCTISEGMVQTPSFNIIADFKFWVWVLCSQYAKVHFMSVQTYVGHGTVPLDIPLFNLMVSVKSAKGLMHHTWRHGSDTFIQHHSSPQFWVCVFCSHIQQSSFYDCTNIWGSSNCALVAPNVQSHWWVLVSQSVCKDYVLKTRLSTSSIFLIIRSQLLELSDWLPIYRQPHLSNINNTCNPGRIIINIFLFHNVLEYYIFMVQI